MTRGDTRRLLPRRPATALHPRVEGLEIRALLSVGSSSVVKGSDAAGDDGDASDPVTPGFKASGLDVATTAGVDAELTVAAYATAGSVGVASAKIDWGDGTDASEGTINDLGLANPVYDAGTISGHHTYAQPGTYKIVVTITENGQDGDGKTATVTSQATVVDPSPVPGPALDVTEAAGFAFTHDRLATFTVGPPGASADSFKAKIDWGDGTDASAGEVVPAAWQPFVLPPGLGPIFTDAAALGANDVSLIRDPASFTSLPTRFNVNGGHTYAQPGTYTITITITDNAGHSAVATATANVVAGPLVASPDSGPVSGVAGWALPDYISLATFTDFRFNDATAPDSASYKATIDWGDGSDTTTGSVEPLVLYWLADAMPATIDAAGFVAEDSPTHPSFRVTGTHSYANPGKYAITITITDENGDTVTATNTAEVTASSLKGQGVPVTAFPGEAFDGVPVATFHDAAGPLPAGAYTATVDWGDGTETSAGDVTGPYWIYLGGPIGINDPSTDDYGGFLQVNGGHTYAQAGSYTITVTIDGPGGSSLTVTTTADVSALRASGLDVNATTNVDLAPVPVATFEAPDADAAASDFTATIDWGDGTTTDGTISQNAWPVVDPPAPPITADGAQDSSKGSDRLLLPIKYPSNWFTVTGAHTYTQAGQYTVKVTISGASGKTATTTSTATVSDEVLKGVGASITATAGQDTGPTDVAKFTDSVPGGDVGRLKATIDWGDGTTTTGNIMADFPPVLRGIAPGAGGAVAKPASASAGGTSADPTIDCQAIGYRVVGKHTYATPGTYTVHVTLTKLDGSTVSIDGKASVAAPPGTASGVAGAPIASGVASTDRKLATFHTHAVKKPGDFTVLIHWGDGSAATAGKLKLAPPPSRSATAGKATPSSKGTSFLVLGTHKFAHPGTYLVRITITGKKGAVTRTTSKVVVIPPPKSHPSHPGKKGPSATTTGMSGGRH